MSPRTCLILGVICLALAQALASGVLARMRAALVPNQDVYGALKPGEFAGTLMLGGFRGLACDLLWSRAQTAKDHGNYYESLALARAISQIQPRFEQIWEYMAWDMAYNIGHEVEDANGQWAWFVAGLEVNVQGALRNPQSERLVRHLAWMFHHKGDDFRAKVEGASWSKLLNPLIEQINRLDASGERLPSVAEASGMGNFQLSELFYRATKRVAAANHLHLPPYVRRMIPLAIERDGNRLRNHGDHFSALRRYLSCLREWDAVLAWSRLPPDREADAQDRGISIEVCQHNQGRLRRKAALLAEGLAKDAALGKRVATAIADGRWDDADQALADADAWRAATARGHIAWLDEP